MPIRFRCTYCNRLLGIATRKAGSETTCPHCGYTITVPVPTEEDGRTERLNLEDVDRLLGHLATERASEPATQVVPPPAPPRQQTEPAREEQPKQAPPPIPKSPAAARQGPPPIPKVTQKPHAPGDLPLFERDFDEIFGQPAAQQEADRPRPAPTSGQDALSLSETPRMLVISAQKATLLMCAVVVLLTLAFAGGYFLAK